MELFFGILFGTFILEDVALGGAILFIAQGKMSFETAFFACFLGISIGDLLLYGFGRLTIRHPRLQQYSLVKNAYRYFSKPQSSRKFDIAVVVSRAVPGTRLPTYIGTGLVGYPFMRFFVLTVLSVAPWVYGSLIAGQSLQRFFSDHLVLLLISFLGVLYLAKKIAYYSVNTWERRALKHAWRKWLHFEFWPAWFFYLPIIPFYIYHSLRTGSFFHPFSANPTLLNGGLTGESKWDFLKHLPQNKSTTLKSALLPKGSDTESVVKKLAELSITYPFVLKPDVGQRGFGVRMIKNQNELTEYLLNADFDIILQEKSRYIKEAGLFYIRHPQMEDHFLFSVTLKEFPVLIGDGHSSLGKLILNDPRARIVASVYFARHRDALDTVIAKDVPFVLSECGNHCQGAVFFNGATLITKELTAAIDNVSKSLPHFYFGRVDIRYNTDHELMAGENFEIIEINGAGSEATHIWDTNTQLLDAYITLFKQWTYLFDIGKAAKKTFPEINNVRVSYFFKDFFKQTTRNHSLAISS